MDTPFTLTSESVYMLISLVVIALGALLSFFTMAAGSRAKAATAEARRATESANATGDFARLVGDLQRQVGDMQRQVGSLRDEVASLTQVRQSLVLLGRSEAARAEPARPVAPAAAEGTPAAVPAPEAEDRTVALGDYGTPSAAPPKPAAADEGTLVAGPDDLARAGRDEFHGHALLRAVAGNNEGEVFTLPYDKCTVGRSPTNRVVLNEEKASRVHAELRFENNRFILKDNGSTNGTLRNGAPITEVPLEFGDRIAIGRTELLFTAEGFDLQGADPAKAIAAYERMLALQPTFVPAMQNLAFLLERDIGRKQEAEAVWQRLRKAEG